MDTTGSDGKINYFCLGVPCSVKSEERLWISCINQITES